MVVSMAALEETNMRVAVLSGKGGTGKTLVSVNLTAVAGNAVYIDCDVEEPNGHLFFNPQIIGTEKIMIKVPTIEALRCTGCRVCVDFCKFNALAYINGRVVIFEEVCHSCGGCILFCAENALMEKKKIIGEIQYGISKKATVITGILNTGEASGVPIIKKLLSYANEVNEKLVFLDCPPGSACIVMESIKEADYCILVAEPTQFGVHNLSMVYELVQLLKKPFGVILNKCLPEENPAEIFCRSKGIKILGEIPFDIQLGMMNSNARIVAKESEQYHGLFVELLQTVVAEVKHEASINS